SKNDGEWDEFFAKMKTPTPRQLGPTEFKSWPEFLARVKERPVRRSFICRGLSDSEYPPTCKLQRIFDPADVASGIRHQIESDSVKYFQDKLGKFTTDGPIPTEDDLLGWLALMQHYGAPTRLIDWTINIWVG